MQFIADLQIHSKYSRAVSKAMDVLEIRRWARRKGIAVVATGDWTHPLWFRELASLLEEVSPGLYRVKPGFIPSEEKESPERSVEFVVSEPLFFLSGEISSIYTQGGKLRRIHTLVFAPDFSIAERINKELVGRGCNLSSDGRPVVGLSAAQVASVALSVDERCLIIPAHAWTPHFSVFGSASGFDSLAECYGEGAARVFAVETGLSSDPAMNWRVKELERRAIVSFSDAHSGPKLGREVTVFEVKSQKSQVKSNQISYHDIYWAIGERYLEKNEGKLEIAYTVEFYPEEGKYHFTGHRACNVVQSPTETRRLGKTCHVCGRPLTVGVMHRVEDLAAEEVVPVKKMGKNGCVGYFHPSDKTRPGYVTMVPLLEILGEVHQAGPGSKSVLADYESLVSHYGSEFAVLLSASAQSLRSWGGERLALGVERVRSGAISIAPGYDGVFGRVRVFEEEQTASREQMSLF